MTFQPYDPGKLPTEGPPIGGDSIIMALPGLPPYKDVHNSIRNVKHPRYESFVALRNAAINAMAGRACYREGIGINFTICSPKITNHWTLNGFLGGIMDTLDGSHGPSFTYLPIVYEDDCQVVESRWHFVEAEIESYELKIDFLSANSDSSHPLY